MNLEITITDKSKENNLAVFVEDRFIDINRFNDKWCGWSEDDWMQLTVEQMQLLFDFLKYHGVIK